MTSPNLKLYRADTLVEIGTEGNLIDFGLCNAGETTELPYQLLLYNDYGGSLNSDDALDIESQILQMNVIQSYVSNGNPSQSFTMSVLPLVEDEEEVTVNDIKWTKVASFVGYGSNDEIYTLNYTTGVLTFGNGVTGKIPPNTQIIKCNYVPDTNVYGKEIYDLLQIKIRSSGVVQNSVSVSSELATKQDNTHVIVFHAPTILTVVGVWDNVGKTGTNYYTGGSFNADTGVITLGSSMSASTPYVEYTYGIKDDDETAYTAIGKETTHIFENKIPSNNAKQLYLNVTLLSNASTEGGVYIQIRLRIFYSF